MAPSSNGLGREALNLTIVGSNPRGVTSKFRNPVRPETGGVGCGLPSGKWRRIRLGTEHILVRRFIIRRIYYDTELI